MSNDETKFKPVTHVLFDMDGLLIDSEHHYAVARNVVAQRYGKTFDFNTAIKLMGSTAIRCAEIVTEALEIKVDPEEFMKECEAEFPKHLPNSQFMPGARRLLDHCKKHNIPCCIASSSEAAAFVLKTAHLGDVFLGQNFFHHVVLGSDDPEVKCSKPQPDVYNVARSRFPDPKPEPEQCLVFEDTTLGVLAGCRAGMQVVMVPDPRLDLNTVPSAKDPDFKPVLILKSLNDFRPELFGLPPYE